MDEIAARDAFEQALRTYRPHEFEDFFLSRLYGLEYAYGEDMLTVRFAVQEFMFNPQGWLHGGVATFVLDVTMGHLLKHALGVPGATLEIKTQFLGPVRRGVARCEAHFLRKGRNICFLEARLFDASGALGVAATSTWRVSREAQSSSASQQGTRAQT